MRFVLRCITVLICAICATGCSMKRDLTSLGNIVVDDFNDSACILDRLTDRSKKLEFDAGTGKPYSVTFQIQVGERQCSTSVAKIDVQWRDLEIDEIPDIGKSKIRLTGGASVFIEDEQPTCSTRDLIIAYSNWYEVRPLSLSEFRPPEDPTDPAAAAKVAFERFIGKFTDFLVEECL